MLSSPCLISHRFSSLCFQIFLNLAYFAGERKLVYSACATYDSFDTHLLSGTNAKNQKTSYTYDTSVAGGFGQWETSTTDVNGQVTSYQYDALGRLTAVIRPGDSASSPTVSYTYTNTCTNGSTGPCIEIDSTTKINASGSNTIVRQYYDGLGRLIES